jgi:hypothetical protein
MRLKFKYKITPALIITILVILYYILHHFFLFRDIIENNDREKDKIKEKAKVERALVGTAVSDVLNPALWGHKPGFQESGGSCLRELQDHDL